MWLTEIGVLPGGKELDKESGNLGSSPQADI